MIWDWYVNKSKLVEVEGESFDNKPGSPKKSISTKPISKKQKNL